MPKFMLLIYDDETAGPGPGEPGWQELWGTYVRLDGEAKASGALIDSQPFQPTSAATTVRVRDGLTGTVSGPAEGSASQLTGYYLMECKDEAEAIAWAAKIPGASTGAVEVRPILEGPP